MRDLTERLRSGFGGLVPPVCDEAANVIEALRAELSDALAVLDEVGKFCCLPPGIIPDTREAGLYAAYRKYKEV